MGFKELAMSSFEYYVHDWRVFYLKQPIQGYKCHV